MAAVLQQSLSLHPSGRFSPEEKLEQRSSAIHSLSANKRLVEELIDDYLWRRLSPQSYVKPNKEDLFLTLRDIIFNITEQYHASKKINHIFKDMTLDEKAKLKLYTLFDNVFGNGFKWVYLGAVFVSAEVLSRKHPDLKELLTSWCSEYITENLWKDIEAKGEWMGFIRECQSQYGSGNFSPSSSYSNTLGYIPCLGGIGLGLAIMGTIFASFR